MNKLLIILMLIIVCNVCNIIKGDVYLYNPKTKLNTKYYRLHDNNNSNSNSNKLFIKQNNGIPHSYFNMYSLYMNMNMTMNMTINETCNNQISIHSINLFILNCNSSSNSSSSSSSSSSYSSSSSSSSSEGNNWQLRNVMTLIIFIIVILSIVCYIIETYIYNSEYISNNNEYEYINQIEVDNLELERQDINKWYKIIKRRFTTRD